MKFAACICMMVLLAGCAMFGPERSQLPRGVTLLDTQKAQCDGTVVFEGDVDVRRGESTVIEVRDPRDIYWSCLGRRHDEGAFRCPRGTDYIRVIREAREYDFTVECFG